MVELLDKQLPHAASRRHLTLRMQGWASSAASWTMQPPTYHDPGVPAWLSRPVMSGVLPANETVGYVGVDLMPEGLVERPAPYTATLTMTASLQKRFKSASPLMECQTPPDATLQRTHALR